MLHTLDADELESMTGFLHRYACSILREDDAADEVVQETLLAALATRKPFAGRSRLQTWLVGILRHKIYDHLREVSRDRKRHHPLPDGREDEYGVDRLRTPVPEEMHDRRSDPARILDSRRALAAVDRVLDELPRRNAAAFRLREVEGWANKEVCDRLGISPGNLWVMIHRARKAVRARLAG